MDNQRDKQEYPRAELKGVQEHMSRDKRLEEIRQNMKDISSIVAVANWRTRCGFLLEEIERLQQREQTELSTAFWGREGLIQKLESKIDQLREEGGVLIQSLKEIEDESSQEDTDITRINGIAQDTLRALGIGEDNS